MNEIDSMYQRKFTDSSLIKIKSDNEFISRANEQKWTLRVNINYYKRAISVNKQLQELISNEINN